MAPGADFSRHRFPASATLIRGKAAERVRASRHSPGQRLGGLADRLYGGSAIPTTPCAAGECLFPPALTQGSAGSQGSVPRSDSLGEEGCLELGVCGERGGNTPRTPLIRRLCLAGSVVRSGGPATTSSTAGLYGHPLRTTLRTRLNGRPSGRLPAPVPDSRLHRLRADSTPPAVAPPIRQAAQNMGDRRSRRPHVSDCPNPTWRREYHFFPVKSGCPKSLFSGQTHRVTQFTDTFFGHPQMYIMIMMRM